MLCEPDTPAPEGGRTNDLPTDLSPDLMGGRMTTSTVTRTQGADRG